MSMAVNEKYPLLSLNEKSQINSSKSIAHNHNEMMAMIFIHSSNIFGTLCRYFYNIIQYQSNSS